MPFGKLVKDPRGLMEISRYQNKYRHKVRSVAEHSWSVAFIAQGLTNWEINKFDQNVDMALVLKQAICHDLIECVTGDIISTTKKKTVAMENAIKEIEFTAFHEQMKPDLPKSWIEEYEELILNPKAEGIEGMIIKAADIIDTILEAIEEIDLGNNSFRPILKISAEELMKVDLKSVRYLIKQIIDLALKGIVN